MSWQADPPSQQCVYWTGKPAAQGSSEARTRVAVLGTRAVLSCAGHQGSAGLC